MEDQTGDREGSPDRPKQLSVGLEEKTGKVAIEETALRVTVATEVLKLFRYSLIGTLSGAGAVLTADLAFIGMGIIMPTDRLMTEAVLMTLIGATVVQVGAALAAIVYALFKSEPPPAG